MNRSVSTNMLNQVSELTGKLFSENDTFIAGVSGGPDSMALLHIMKELGRTVLVVHINFGLRGSEADADQELVEGFSAAWGFECCSVRVDPGEREIRNVQHWARKVRYDIFRDLLVQGNYKAILTAHHKDDQVETILQKVLGGSSPETWQGMQISDPPLFKPLINFSKEDLLEYCDEQSVPFRTDSSNHKPGYFRNAIRQQIAPVLDNFSPGWEDNLLSLRTFGGLNEQAVEFICSKINDDKGISVSELKNMPVPLALSVLKNYVNMHVPVVVSRGQLQQLLKLTESQPGRFVDLTPQIRMVRDRSTLSLQKLSQRNPDRYISEPETDEGVEVAGWNFRTLTRDKSERPGEITLSVSKTTWPLHMESWDHGDAFTPLGMSGTKKVSDFLTDRKIPSSQRENILKLTGADGTIHALLYPESNSGAESGAISDHVKITDTDTRILSITKNPEL